jgi:hypothetical protein
MRFILDREEIPFRAKLIPYFADPKFTRLCDCGCNSFDLLLPEDESLPLLRAPGRYGMFFEVNYELPEKKVLEFLFFADKQGRLSGVDVEVSGNNFPVPDEPGIGKLVYVWSAE